MRDLTKSMMSFSWALSLFGLRQMTCMLTPQGWRGASSSFDHVTRSTEDQLGSATRSFFRVGDSLQRGMVDLMFNMFTLGMANDGRGSRTSAGQDAADQVGRAAQWGADTIQRSAQMGADALQRSADAARYSTSGTGGNGAPASAGSEGIGWGPMPGTR